LVTSLYYGYDQYIETDTVFGVSNSLIIDPRSDVPGSPFPALRSIAYDFTLVRAMAGDENSRVGADPASLLAAD
jgi:hypothetical protein